MTTKKVTQNVVVGGVIFHGKKVLILKRTEREKILPNYWELPSGKKLPQEEVESCLVREVKEETGLTIKPILPFSVFEYQVTNENRIQFHTQINYLSELSENRGISLSKEHSDFAWIRRDEMPNHHLSKEVRSVITRAFKLRKITDLMSGRRKDKKQ